MRRYLNKQEEAHTFEQTSSADDCNGIAPSCRSVESAWLSVCFANRCKVMSLVQIALSIWLARIEDPPYALLDTTIITERLNIYLCTRVRPHRTF